MTALNDIALVKPTRLPSRRQVVGIIAKYIELLDDGAHVVDANVQLPNAPAIDVLARGSHGEWLVVDVFDGANPSWIARMLHHLKWVDGNQTYLATMLGEHDLHEAVKVRGAAVLAKYTETAQSALSFLERAPLECFVARCFATASGETFLALEKPKETTLAVPLSSSQPQPQPASRHLRPIELTDDEINDFLAEERPGGQRKSARSFI